MSQIVNRRRPEQTRPTRPNRKPRMPGLRRNMLAVMLAMLGALTACGGGGSDQSSNSGDAVSGPGAANPAPASPSSPAPGPLGPSELGKVMLYLATSESGSTYDPYSGVTIQHAGLSVFRFVPAINRINQVAWGSSASYAADTLAPYTVDDRLFFRSGSPGPEIPGIQRWSEADPLATTNQFFAGQLIQEGAIRRGCSAVVGQRYFFEGNTASDLFNRTYYGELRVVTLGAGAAASMLLLPRADRDRCRGNLHSAGGKLYDAEFDGTRGLMQLHRRSLDNGRIVETVPLAITDSASWGPCGSAIDCGYKFAFDDGVAYFARKRIGDQRVQLWRYRFGGPAAIELVYETTLSGFDLNYMDSDDGYVMLAHGPGQKVLVIDTLGAKAELYATPFKFFDPQILILRR